MAFFLLVSFVFSLFYVVYLSIFQQTLENTKGKFTFTILNQGLINKYTKEKTMMTRNEIFNITNVWNEPHTFVLMF